MLQLICFDHDHNHYQYHNKTFDLNRVWCVVKSLLSFLVMVAKAHLQFGKTMSDTLQDSEGLNTADEDHVEGDSEKLSA